MRGPSFFSVIALLAMLISNTAYGQPTASPSPDPKDVKDLAVRAYMYSKYPVLIEIDAAGGYYKWKALQIDRQFGEFLDKVNGVPVQTRSIDNTEAARRELTYTLTSPFFSMGGTGTVGVGHGFFVGGGGSLYLGMLELDVVDSQQAEVTYDHATEPIGYSLKFIAGKAHQFNDDFMVLVRGEYEHISLDAESLTRTPAQTVTGGTFTRTQYALFHDEERVSSMVEMLSFYRGLGRIRPRVRIGYLSMNTSLTTVATVDYAQTLAGLTSEFTGQTDLSKDGFYGSVGARFAITHGFNATAEYSFGAEKGLTFGGSYTFSARK